MKIPFIRVLLVDDHPVARAGLRAILEKEADIRVIGEASNGADALTLYTQLLPDILLLDMELPGMKGYEVIQCLMARKDCPSILVISAYAEKGYIHELLAMGIAGYLVKEEAPELIVNAVRGVSRGERGWFSRRISTYVTDGALRGGKFPVLLSLREVSLLRELVQGKTNQEIAVQMGIKQKTVEKHLENIYEKLGVSSRVEAAVLTIKEGIL